MEFPDRCIRGIPSMDCLLQGGTVASLSLFAFPSARCRGDGWIDESINWMDNDRVGDFTLSQTKEDGQPQFPVGIAVVRRTELDGLKKKSGFAGHFDYERARIEGNDYHGNLLLRGDIEKRLKNLIRSALAIASDIMLRERDRD